MRTILLSVSLLAGLGAASTDGPISALLESAADQIRGGPTPDFQKALEIFKETVKFPTFTVDESAKSHLTEGLDLDGETVNSLRQVSQEYDFLLDLIGETDSKQATDYCQLSSILTESAPWDSLKSKDEKEFGDAVVCQTALMTHVESFVLQSTARIAVLERDRLEIAEKVAIKLAERSEQDARVFNAKIRAESAKSSMALQLVFMHHQVFSDRWTSIFQTYKARLEVRLLNEEKQPIIQAKIKSLDDALSTLQNIDRDVGVVLPLTLKQAEQEIRKRDQALEDAEGVKTDLLSRIDRLTSANTAALSEAAVDIKISSRKSANSRKTWMPKLMQPPKQTMPEWLSSLKSRSSRRSLIPLKKTRSRLVGLLD